MLYNYMVITLRSLKRNFTYAFINIFGFSVGLSSCIVISLYVKTEISYDQFHSNVDRLYRYIPSHTENGEVTLQTWSTTGLAPFLLNNFPSDIEKVARVIKWDENGILNTESREIMVKNIILADSSFFEMFSFRLVGGNVMSALNRPMTIAISRQVAENNFAGQDPIGKVLKYQGKYDFEVTAVFENVPTNSHLQFSAVISMTSLTELWKQFGPIEGDILDDFHIWNYSTYILTAEHANLKKLQLAASEKFYERYTNGLKRKDGQEDWLQPIKEIHFTKGIKGDVMTAEIKYIHMAISLGAIILLIACFNFINLSTAMSMRKAKEVGLRKSLGALRSQLVTQFMGEILVQILLSVILAFICVQILLPAIEQNIGISVVSDSSQKIIFLAAFTILTTILAGAYPSFYLSSFKPAIVLKGSVPHTGKPALRKVLTICQFTAAIFLVAISWIALSQIIFMTKKDLGYSKDNIITMYGRPEIIKNYQSFKNSLLSHSDIIDVTLSNSRVGNLQSLWRYTLPNGEIEGSQAITTLLVDDNYIDFMNLELSQGRRLSKEFATDEKKAFMVNESFVEHFRLQNPLETYLQVGNDSSRKGLIVGIVKNFHFQSLHKSISPIVLRMDERNLSMISIKLQNGKQKEGLKTIESEWKKYSLDTPYDFKYLSDHISESYKYERQASVFLIALTVISIIISSVV